jgi:hypothetical protein
MGAFFKFMAEYGVWEIISLIVALFPSILVLIYLFPRKSVKNLYVDNVTVEAPTEQFPKHVDIRLRNHTNTPLYVLSEGFKFGKAIRPFPGGAKDVATGLYEVKFEGRQRGILSEIDVLVRPNETVWTYMPVDPDHSKESIDEALRKRQLGTLNLKVKKISTRPHPFTSFKIDM